MIKKTIIKVLGKDYEISFPNVGQIQDIEAMKLAITKNKYAEMAISGLKTQGFALDLADAIAYLSVLIPSLQKDLNVSNWRELDSFIAKKLIIDFKENFYTWYKPIMDDLYNFEQDSSDAESIKE
jgi:hypothetical protein